MPIDAVVIGQSHWPSVSASAQSKVVTVLSFAQGCPVECSRIRLCTLDKSKGKSEADRGLMVMDGRLIEDRGCYVLRWVLCRLHA